VPGLGLGGKTEGVISLLAHCHVTVTVMIRDMVTVAADNPDLMIDPMNPNPTDPTLD